MEDVTSIGCYAFLDCESLEEVILPDINRIAETAFDGCEALEYFELGTGFQYPTEFYFEECDDKKGGGLGALSPNIRLVLCENVLPAPVGNTWNGLNWKSITIVPPNIGIKEKTDDFSSIQVYPNPTTGELTIENGELRIKGVEVFDVYGRKQLTIDNGQLTINISNFSAGVYFVRITTENGVVIKKVVKE